MAVRHLLLALSCVLLWGANFVVIRVGLDDLPPLAFASLRFAVAALPALLLPRPQVRWQLLAGYGLLWGTIQFGGLFLAMTLGLPAGLASVTAQSQVFFTLLLLVASGHERWSAHFAPVLLLALMGIGLLAADPVAPVPLLALALALAGAAAWGGANLLVRLLGQQGVRTDSLAFISWACWLPALSLALLSATTESWQPLAALHGGDGWRALLAVLYQSLLALLLGTLIWNRLLRHYPASQVAPFSLLVPPVGLLLAALLLDEWPSPWQLAGSVLLFTALLVNLYGHRLRRQRPPCPEPL